MGNRHGLSAVRLKVENVDNVMGCVIIEHVSDIGFSIDGNRHARGSET